MDKAVFSKHGMVPISQTVETAKQYEYIETAMGHDITTRMVAFQGMHVLPVKHGDL